MNIEPGTIPTDPKERKKFLAMDMIERMIRVEQRVSASFGKYVDYKNTEYYKSLPFDKKREYERYLKMRGVKKVAFSSVFVLACGATVFSGMKFTGNVINEGTTGINPLTAGLLLISAVLAGLIGYSFVAGRRRGQKLDGHVKALHKYIG